MKEISMRLKEVPDGYYVGLSETVYCISPDKVYMVKQVNVDNEFETIKYFFRLPTKYNVYEGLITEQLYEGIRRDNYFDTNDIKFQAVYEYIFGKDTIRVISECSLFHKDEKIVAIGPEENEEWQNEFQRYHI